MNHPIVSVDWLNEHLNDNDLIILDASPSSTITIPKARRFDVKNDFSDTKSPFPNTVPSEKQFEKGCQQLGIHQSSKIVVYDNLGIHLSPRVWWLFKIMGHENIAILNGGLPEWLKKGYNTIDQKYHTYELGTFKAKRQDQFIKTYEDILDNTKTNSFLLVDVRAAGRFDGTAKEPRKHLKSGHIPHSINIPYKTLLEDGKYKSSEAMKAIFESKCNHSKDLVFSCGSGITACIAMVACEIAFKNSRYINDGSWTEWAERQGLKIEEN